MAGMTKEQILLFLNYLDGQIDKCAGHRCKCMEENKPELSYYYKLEGNTLVEVKYRLLEILKGSERNRL